MKRGTALTLAGISAAALLLVMAIGYARIAQRRQQRDIDDLKRWEGEGGPPHPDDVEGSTDAA